MPTDLGRSRAVAKRWNRNARVYDLLTEPMERVMGFATARPRVFSRVGTRRMLEVGAGTGRNLTYYPDVAFAVAIDISELMLARAARKAGPGSPVRFVVADAEDLPFRDGAFEAVAATCVFCSVPDPVRALREVRRVLRPDGEAVFLEHVRPSGLRGRLFDLLDPLVSRVVGPHINRRTLDNIRRAGLEVREEQNVRSDWVKTVAAGRGSRSAGAGPVVEVYGKRECGLCDEVKATLERVRRDVPFELREIDIESSAELYDTYKQRIPLVFIDGHLAFKFHVDEIALRRRLADVEGTDPGDDHGLARRRLLNWFLATSAGALAVAILYPIARYLVPPVVSESTAGAVTLPIKPSDVKANSGEIFKFGSRPGILIRTPAGELRAFSAVCTHLQCTVQYRPDLQHIWCACHNGHYDLNGKNIAGPPPRPLDAYVVNVRGDQIIVSKGA